MPRRANSNSLRHCSVIVLELIKHLQILLQQIVSRATALLAIDQTLRACLLKHGGGIQLYASCRAIGSVRGHGSLSAQVATTLPEVLLLPTRGAIGALPLQHPTRIFRRYAADCVKPRQIRDAPIGPAVLLGVDVQDPGLAGVVQFVRRSGGAPNPGLALFRAVSRANC